MRIAFVTGSRAEFGIMKQLMMQIHEHPSFEFQFIVTGSHLSERHGNTIQEMERLGLPIHSKVPILSEQDGPLEIARAVGLGTIKLAESFDGLSPDIVVILGDRYEMLAAAQAAFILRIPIIHLHGGEVTEGAIDDAIRHAISKMASMHFVANEQYRMRLIRMGEQPDRIYNFGSPGIDELLVLRAQQGDSILAEFFGPSDRKTAMVTYHPVTMQKGYELAGLDALIEAMLELDAFQFILTGANADHYGSQINQRFEQLVQRMPERFVFEYSLGRYRYTNLLKEIDVMLGNSSSGIIEANYFGVPTVDLGDRQKGRLKPQSVIECREQKDAIIAAVQLALSEPFRRECIREEMIYGDGHAVERMVELISNITDVKQLLNKSFYDL